MPFEFDPAKSAANKAKHGLDFVEAQELWQDIEATELPARSEAEPRKMLVATTGGKIWTAIFTERGEILRIISVRRARAAETAIYEHENHRQKP